MSQVDTCWGCSNCGLNVNMLSNWLYIVESNNYIPWIDQRNSKCLGIIIGMWLRFWYWFTHITVYKSTKMCWKSDKQRIRYNIIPLTLTHTRTWNSIMRQNVFDLLPMFANKNNYWIRCLVKINARNCELKVHVNVLMSVIGKKNNNENKNKL